MDLDLARWVVVRLNKLFPCARIIVEPPHHQPPHHIPRAIICKIWLRPDRAPKRPDTCFTHRLSITSVSETSLKLEWNEISSNHGVFHHDTMTVETPHALLGWLMHIRHNFRKMSDVAKWKFDRTHSTKQKAPEFIKLCWNPYAIHVSRVGSLDPFLKLDLGEAHYRVKGGDVRLVIPRPGDFNDNIIWTLPTVGGGTVPKDLPETVNTAALSINKTLEEMANSKVGLQILQGFRQSNSITRFELGVMAYREFNTYAAVLGAKPVAFGGVTLKRAPQLADKAVHVLGMPRTTAVVAAPPEKDPADPAPPTP